MSALACTNAAMSALSGASPVKLAPIALPPPNSGHAAPAAALVTSLDTGIEVGMLMSQARPVIIAATNASKWARGRRATVFTPPVLT